MYTRIGIKDNNAVYSIFYKELIYLKRIDSDSTSSLKTKTQMLFFLWITVSTENKQGEIVWHIATKSDWMSQIYGGIALTYTTILKASIHSPILFPKPSILQSIFKNQVRILGQRFCMLRILVCQACSSLKTINLSSITPLIPSIIIWKIISENYVNLKPL